MKLPWVNFTFVRIKFNEQTWNLFTLKQTEGTHLEFKTDIRIGSRTCLKMETFHADVQIKLIRTEVQSMDESQLMPNGILFLPSTRNAEKTFRFI